MNIEYLAHSPTEDNPKGQPLIEHLDNVSRLSTNFSDKFGAKSRGRFMGKLHDIGKYSDAFQQKLRGKNQFVDHSTAGAYVAFQNGDAASAFAILGHHSGLPDIGTKLDIDGTFQGRMSNENISSLEDFSAYKSEIGEIDVPKRLCESNENVYFYIKMLFSALVDADWTDTGRYFKNELKKEQYDSLAALKDKLDNHFSSMRADDNEINRLRSEIREYATGKADNKPGLFSLTVPTGGGKTLTSMDFSLKHAIANKMDRIIYVIPYCSILEQTGKIFCDIFGEENVLLHYSTAIQKSTDECDPNAFSSEQWDQPIILTTSVQFFESLYSNRPSRSRKLHNICNSVIIFDEAQMLPINYILPCVFAICQMIKRYNCTGVLCTATQPAINRLIDKYIDKRTIELCPRPLEMNKLFKRTSYVYDGEINDDSLVEKLKTQNQVLCIVNNRAQAQKIFGMLGSTDSFCLTTLLTPNDRNRQIGEIAKRLKSGDICRVISTSLIEAGVDLDFPCVYRAVSGLDSIIQAGGRCNREGKRTVDESYVHIFEPEANPPRILEQNICSAKRVIKKYGNDIACEAAIREYFEFLLYTLKDETSLDRKDIVNQAKQLNFKTVSDSFNMIESRNEVTLYIFGNGGDETIDKMRKSGVTGGLLKSAARFGICITKEEANLLVDLGKAEMIYENGAVLTDVSCYDAKTGFSNNNKSKPLFG